ncbi:MAG: glycosyltransferase family 4 protein [Thainema sp.]
MSNLDETAHFFLLLPNIFGFKGGIQVYSIFLLKTLQQLYPDAEYDLFLKYDRLDHIHDRFGLLPQTRFHCLGDHPRIVQTVLMAGRTLQRGVQAQPSLIIASHVNYSPVCQWLKQISGVPYWVIAHGLEVWDLQRTHLRKALQQADQVVAVSHFTRDRILHEQDLRAEQVVVLPNTLDPQQFQIGPKPDYLLKRYGLQPQQPVIFTVSRLGKLDTYKGYDQILRALPIIRQQIPDVHYILAGKGDDTPRIQQLIDQLGLEDAVTLTGFIPDQELCDHYNLCDVFALPSKGEGFGIVYLEALACGKPVLAGNCDGAVDPLEHGTMGYLVNPDDELEIAQTLIDILCDRNCLNSHAQKMKLRNRAISKFGLAQFQKQLALMLEQQNPIQPKTPTSPERSAL